MHKYKSLMYKEEDLAKEVYENGFTDKTFNFSEATLLAKYFRHTLGYGDARTKSSLILFTEEQDKFFNRILNSGNIKKIMTRSKKGYVDKSKDIAIYQEEIDNINRVMEYKSKKVLFSILVLSKRVGSNGYLGNHEWNHIRRTIHSKIPNKKIFSLMQEFHELGLVDPSYKSHKVLFLSEEGKQAGVVTSNSIYSLNKIFEELFGFDLFVCIDCKKENIRKSYNQKRCKVCSEKNKRVRWRLQKIRQRKKMST